MEKKAKASGVDADRTELLAGALPLKDAMQKFVDPQLWTDYRDAHEGWRRHGRPPWGSANNADGEEASLAQREAVAAVEASKRRNAAQKQIKKTFLRMLSEGRLVAFGKKSIVSELEPIPPDAWRHLDIVKLAKGQVASEGIAFWDVVVAESQTVAANPQKDAFLELTVDRKRRLAVFRGGIMYSENIYSLLDVLVRPLEEPDHHTNKSRPPDAKELAKLLGIRVEDFRILVSDFRKQLKNDFRRFHGVGLADHDIIVSGSWHGYRLAAHIRVKIVSEDGRVRQIMRQSESV